MHFSYNKVQPLPGQPTWHLSENPKFPTKFFSNHHSHEGTKVRRDEGTFNFKEGRGNLWEPLPFPASLLAHAFGPAEMPYNNAGELASEVAQVSAAHSPWSARHRVQGYFEGAPSSTPRENLTPTRPDAPTT